MNTISVFYIGDDHEYFERGKLYYGQYDSYHDVYYVRDDNLEYHSYNDTRFLRIDKMDGKERLKYSLKYGIKLW